MCRGTQRGNKQPMTNRFSQAKSQIVARQHAAQRQKHTACLQVTLRTTSAVCGAMLCSGAMLSGRLLFLTHSQLSFNSGNTHSCLSARAAFPVQHRPNLLKMIITVNTNSYCFASFRSPHPKRIKKVPGKPQNHLQTRMLTVVVQGRSEPSHSHQLG